MKVTLLAKSDSGNRPHKVEFLADGPSVRVYCHCRAGINQWICKHKMELIKGDVERLFDPKQAELLSEIQSWSQFEDLKRRTEEFKNRLKEIHETRINISAELSDQFDNVELEESSFIVCTVVSPDDPELQAVAESRRQEKALKEEFARGLTFGFYRNEKT